MIDVQRVLDLNDLLTKNKNAPIEDIVKVFESGDNSIPFNPDVSFSTEAENLPVCQAVRAGRYDLLKLLTEKYNADVDFSFCMNVGSEVITISFQNYTFLHCCQNYDMCNKMLSLTSKDKMNCANSVLHSITRAAIVKHTNTRLFQLVFDKINSLPIDKDGRTILHHLAIHCKPSTSPDSPIIAELTQLAKIRASIDIFDSYELTALQYACWSGSLAAVRVLLAAGADVNKYHGEDSCTALHLAVAIKSIDVVHELLHAGAKTDTNVNCTWVENNQVQITGDPSDVARVAGNFRLARYVADPLRSSLGVLLDSEGGDTSAIMFEPIPGETIDGTCDICLDETKLIPLSRCHHAFCKSCLANWFRSSSNGVSRPQCPYSGCNLPVSVYDIKAVLGRAEADRVDQLLFQRCLAEMPDFRWCPHCNYGGFFVGQDGPMQCKDAKCDNCGYQFCTLCQQDAHPGMSCDSKCHKKFASFISEYWISENTKPCPACHTPIVKDGGCSHMRCTRCKYEFCWFCMGKYQGYYTFENKCPCPK